MCERTLLLGLLLLEGCVLVRTILVGVIRVKEQIRSEKSATCHPNRCCARRGHAMPGRGEGRGRGSHGVGLQRACVWCV
jgi:hypothetical protein